MQEVLLAECRRLSRPHPNLGDEVNRNIVQSEIEGGVFLGDLPPSTVLQIHTQHHCYTMLLLGGGNALISGHPQYCPEPILVLIAGSTWGGSMLKRRFVGRGMQLEFHHPEYRMPIVTPPSGNPGEHVGDWRVRHVSIDGYGTLQVNALVSFKVLFQRKKYKGSVSPSNVRDFRGAMSGRADKGIIITTGTFTADARREASRDGVPPIELIDGEKLVEMFKELEFGLKPVKTYEIDDSFFDEFRR